MAVITVNYAWTNPAGGGYQTSTTTAPTTTQAFYLSELICLLNAGDADTTCTITHNFNLSAAEQTNFYPDISYIPNTDSAGTVAPVLKFVVATNTIAVTKLNTVAGSGGTYRVMVARPNTIVR